MARSTASSPLPRRLRQLAVVGGVLAALVFAVQGGEYGTRDLLRQRARRAALVATNDSLQRVIDSLRAYKLRLEPPLIVTESEIDDAISRLAQLME